MKEVIVLILILMEYSLTVTLWSISVALLIVLILILMEYSLTNLKFFIMLNSVLS